MASIVPDLDFTSIANLGNIYNQAQARAKRQEVLGQLGQGGGPLDYQNAARSLLAAGDTEGGLSLAKLAQQQYLTSPEYITKSETAKAEVAQKFAPKTSNFKLPGGEEVTAVQGPNGYQIPQIGGLPQPDPNQPQPPPGVDARKWRENRATQLSNIDDKAILEADKAVQAGSAAVGALNKALELNKTAFAGPLAKIGGYGLSVIPGDPTGLKSNAVDTEELQNTVTNQALENLRGIFGGNPTEGERKILLDIQGAPSQAREVRERIYRNAIESANKRIEFNKRTAEQMRGGTYLLPEGQRNPQPQQPQQRSETWKNKETITAARANPQATISEAMQAIQRGADANAVRQRLRAIGLDLPQGNSSAGAIY